MNNSLVKEVFALLNKDITLEWRQRNMLNSILLYIVSTVFIVYMSISLKSGKIHPLTWNALYWIILLFASINSVSKSFLQEGKGRFFYYYSICNPSAIIISKIIYNTALMVVIAMLGALVYFLVMGNPVQDLTLFLLNVLLGAIGFATTLTLIAAISAKTNNSSTLMAILGFPIMLPMILMLLKVSSNAMDGLDWTHSSDEVMTLLSLDLIVVSLSIVLFPYLWRS